MELSRVSAKGQMTIPKRARIAAHLAAGDVVTVVVEDDRLIIRKLPTGDDAYLRGVQDQLSEWNSAEDEDAWRDL
jgi:AbrB family looped-hinge helix DNA binding protein